MVRFVLCHGGAGSDAADEDGPRAACQRGQEILDAGQSALEAAVAATACLEDDVRFNAGTGSNLRLDGKTIEMDAACMSSDGAFGAVAAIQRVKNPVQVAQRVSDTPHILLAGEGATAFARRCGFDEHDPGSSRAVRRFEQLLSVQERIGEWSLEGLRQAWNFDAPIEDALGGDTVGALAWDGGSFAAALSSGGTTAALRGRVGDVPLPGCGLYAGPAGAVAATGDGEYIARAILAYRAYRRLEEGYSAEAVVDWALAELSADIDIGLLIANEAGFAGSARHGMAWYGRSDGKESSD